MIYITKVINLILCLYQSTSINFEQWVKRFFLLSLWNLFFDLNNSELKNCKTLKSNKERAIYKPCQIEHPNPYLTAVNYCCKELHVTCDRVPGLSSDTAISQQSEALLRNNYFTYILTRVSNSCQSLLRYLLYICVNVNLPTIY